MCSRIASTSNPSQILYHEGKPSKFLLYIQIIVQPAAGEITVWWRKIVDNFLYCLSCTSNLLQGFKVLQLQEQSCYVNLCWLRDFLEEGTLDFTPLDPVVC